MSRYSIRRKLGNALRISMVALFSATLLAQVTIMPVLAQDAPNNGPATDKESVIEGFPAYEEGCGDGTMPTGGSSLSGLDKFLQVLAFKESSGNPKAPPHPASGASGKYQYIIGTWASHTKEYYPPASKYGQAFQAPEPMQDAVAYIEYGKKFKKYNNDIFKLALSHFLPAAIDDPSLLDKKPGANKITPRQYAQDIVNKVNSEGPWTNVKLHYKEAPEFDKYAKAAGLDVNQSTGLKYEKAGNIPAEGTKVGATLYGGAFVDGQWKARNTNQDPTGANGPTDDNGLGYAGAPGPLAGTTSYAELSIDPAALDYKAMGGLKPKQKLAITYNGKTIVAEKRDVGGGGGKINGVDRKIDLWWETARLLDMKDNAVLDIRPVSDDTPLTPVGGQATDITEKAVQCETVCGASSGQILLDPGHSGGDQADKAVYDKATGLTIGDSSNPGERAQTFATAKEVEKILTKAGYSVKMTKQKEDDYVNLKARAEMANDMKAVLAVSIHSTGGNFGRESEGWVTPQKVGHYRENPGKREEFKLKDVAAESQRIAGIMAKTRSATGDKAQVHDLNFDTRKDLSDGNISIVQLFSKVPWVYNEVGQKGYDSAKYAKGIAAGIMEAIDKEKGGKADQECSGGQGDIVKKAEALAWHDGRKGLTPRSEYVKAVKNSTPDRKGMLADCGTFVGTVVVDSKVDTKFPHGYTPAIEDYILGKGKSKWENVPNKKTTENLRGGEVFVVNGGSGGSGADGHTYIYIGKHGRFNAAAASLNSYMPTYNVTYFSDHRGSYIIGRAKGGDTTGKI